MNIVVKRIFTLLWGAPGTRLSPEDREISESIRRLKTLKVKDGHVSIDPSEIVTDAFIQDRRDARRLLSK
ncbi:hypothetical protein [Pseudomonas sp. PDM11]|uniref:hypothetical protein n=1 Tax=Pseudomonas sp. PDM11 TaxID=2769309 RepID=UPI0017849874|nr:hypothetical protein [Pseudomonas sp. PDM11]MBD9399098.1 hypothetical protein [Pseudomonas sp. PDM11]